LRRLKWDRRVFPALRAGCLGFNPLDIARTYFTPLHAGCFARLAPLGLILEALVSEKHLLACGENKLPAAFCTLQDLVMVFHTLLPGPGSQQDKQPYSFTPTIPGPGGLKHRPTGINALG
jgi:hypothetical protein